MREREYGTNGNKRNRRKFFCFFPSVPFISVCSVLSFRLAYLFWEHNLLLFICDSIPRCPDSRFLRCYFAATGSRRRSGVPGRRGRPAQLTATNGRYRHTSSGSLPRLSI